MLILRVGIGPPIGGGGGGGGTGPSPLKNYYSLFENK